MGILFTPWGEGLVHAYYRRIMTALSHLPQVSRVAIQTNLSAPLDDFATANRQTLALWTTYHPTETTLTRFLGRCRELNVMGIRYSVGVVGLREHFAAIARIAPAASPGIFSDNTNVIAVGLNNQLIAAGIGTCTITTSYLGYSVSEAVSVQPARLGMILNQTNAFLFWPSNSAKLQSSNSLDTSNNWSPVTGQIFSVGGTNMALIPITNSVRYFRLSY